MEVLAIAHMEMHAMWYAMGTAFVFSVYGKIQMATEASMRIAIFILLWLLTSWVSAADMQLTWDAPTTKEDGTPLDDLAKYRIYRSATSGQYDTPLHETADAQSTSYTINNHPSGVFYYVITAVNEAGKESKKSNEAVFSIAPGEPINVKITITIQVP